MNEIKHMRNMFNLSRREALAASGVALLASMLTPRLVEAAPDAVAREIARLYGERAPALDGAAAGGLRLDVPAIAENGMVVPISVEVESPMTEADHVRAIHVFADGNPLPGVVSYHFTPASGRAAAATRIRLAQSQGVVAVAELSDGRLLAARRAVQVTVGGCAG
jgi:sulfur-oxidizing protein SoxY